MTEHCKTLEVGDTSPETCPETSLEKCRILGVLDDGIASLSATALQHLQAAQLVIGGARTLHLFAVHIAPNAVQRDLTGALSQVPEWIRTAQAEHQRVVVLATGSRPTWPRACALRRLR